jgi:hypothetical protein
MLSTHSPAELHPKPQKEIFMKRTELETWNQAKKRRLSLRRGSGEGEASEEVVPWYITPFKKIRSALRV